MTTRLRVCYAHLLLSISCFFRADIMTTCVCISHTCHSAHFVLSHFSRLRLSATPSACSVHRVFQANILEWVAISSSRVSSQPRDQTHISYISCTGRQVLFHSCGRKPYVERRSYHLKRTFIPTYFITVKMLHADDENRAEYNIVQTQAIQTETLCVGSIYFECWCSEKRTNWFK